MDKNWTINRYFYQAVEADDDDHTMTVQELHMIEADHSYADAKSAIANATGRVVKLVQVNYGLLEMKDVTETTAIALWNECQAAGESVSDSAYADFIRDHVPASYDCGYRGSEDYADEDKRPGLTGDAAVYCEHQFKTAAE